MTEARNVYPPLEGRPMKNTICLFDLDGTLCPEKQTASPEMHSLLCRLRHKCAIGYVSGGPLIKQQQQLGTPSVLVTSLFDFCFAENGLTAFRIGVLLPGTTFIEQVGEIKYNAFVSWVLKYIANLDIRWGLKWRAIFAFDGMLGLLVALILWLRDFSSADEVSSSVRVQNLNYWAGWKRNLMGFVDPKNILSVAILICCNLAAAPTPCYLALHSHISFAYVPYFFFTVFADMGPSHLTFNVLMIAPYFVSICSIFIVARMSDKLQIRGYFVVVYMLVSALGFGIMSLVTHFEWNEWVSYFAIFPACIGCYGAVTITISWALGNEWAGCKRGLVLTILLGAAQLAALFSPAGVKPWWRAVDEPSHPRGLRVCAALMALGAILALALRTYLARRNYDTEKHSYAPVGDGDILADEVEDCAIKRYIV